MKQEYAALKEEKASLVRRHTKEVADINNGREKALHQQRFAEELYDKLEIEKKVTPHSRMAVRMAILIT